MQPGHRRSASVLSVASSLADLSISRPARVIPAIDGTQLMEIDELDMDTHATTVPDDTQTQHPPDLRNDDAGHLNDSDSQGGFTNDASAGESDNSSSGGGFTDKEGSVGGVDADTSSGGFTDDARLAGAASDSDSSGGFTDNGAAEPARDTDSSGGFTDDAHGDSNPRVTPLQFAVDGKTRWEDVNAQHARWTQNAATEWRAMPAKKRYTNNVALAPSLEQRPAPPRAKANHNFEVPGPGEVIELSDDDSPPVEFPGNSLTEEVFQHSRIKKTTHSGLSEHGCAISGKLAPAEYTQWLRVRPSFCSLSPLTQIHAAGRI